MSRPRFVTLHPKDTGFGLPRAFWGHPYTFTPRADQDGRDTDDDDDDDTESFGLDPATMRTMTTSGMYFNMISPEKQFVNALIEKKIKRLEALDTSELERSDYILNIQLTGEESVKVWRRVKISGGLSLAVLADKIITPLMGWTRNYHAHLWTDFKDGSVFGPKDCRAIDMMWINQRGWESIPEPKWKVAHMWRKPGDVIEWLYDLGDRWEHDVLCESVFPASESNGKVEVLDGFGACPREDGKTVTHWKEDLEKLSTGDYKEKREILLQIYSSMNYKDKGLTPWANPYFDPTSFDKAEAVAAVEDALSLPGSHRQGSKTWMLPLASDALKKHEEGMKGKKVHTMNTPEDGGFLVESTTGKRDGLSARVCSMCGTPHNLRLWVSNQISFGARPAYAHLPLGTQPVVPSTIAAGNVKRCVDMFAEG
ncbi:hypothetical protein FRC04_011808 [Tulasnella sp. 424]|nr:hypothetical protein FRC04_011808 [Tulasnella sp. 424]